MPADLTGILLLSLAFIVLFGPRFAARSLAPGRSQPTLMARYSSDCAKSGANLANGFDA